MNLTDLAYYSRKYGPIAVLSLIFFGLLFYTIYLIIIASTPAPKKALYINPVFGKIDLPKIKGEKLSQKISYELDTIEGVPITATLSAKVFEFQQKRTKLTYLERIYLMAKTLGFDTTQTTHQRKGEIATFSDSDKDFQVNIKDYNFTFSYKPSWILQNLENFYLPEKELSLQYAKEVLISLDKYPKDLAQGKTNLMFITFQTDTGKEQITTSPDLAKAIKIDFYRKEENFPIVSSYYPESQNYAIVTIFESKPLILKAQIKFFEIDRSQEGIYPLITGEKAFEKLKQNQAFIIKLPEQMPKTIYIKKMFLAYYDPDEFTPFFQPFYVFLGKDFVAYVPAIREDFLKGINP